MKHTVDMVAFWAIVAVMVAVAGFIAYVTAPYWLPWSLIGALIYFASTTGWP